MREFSVGKNLTAATKTTLYTVPTGYYAKWNLLYMVNHTAGNKHFDVLWYDKSETTEIKLFDNYSLTAGQYLRFDGGADIILEEGDEIRAETEAGAAMSIIVTIDLIRKA